MPNTADRVHSRHDRGLYAYRDEEDPARWFASWTCSFYSYPEAVALIAYVDTLADQGPLIDLPPEHLEDLAEHWSNFLELDITGIEDELRAGHVIPIT